MLVVAMAAVVGCSGVSKSQYKAKEAEATKYQQTAQEQSAQVAELQTKVSTLEQQNETLQSQNKTLESNASDLQSQLNQSSAAAAEMQERRPQKVSQPVFFKENSSTLTSEGKRTLDSIAEGLAGSKDKVVIVSGFTDAAEAAGQNAMAKRWQLSSARALTAAKYLGGRGVDQSLIAVAGFGQARPVAPNDSLASRARNRRVEIMLSPANQQVLTIDLKPAELKKSGTGAGTNP
jgi:chemotaxis protein MotB